MVSHATSWLLTWTTYGTWLPGDRRGFVSSIRDQAGTRVRHNQPATEYASDLPGLSRYARSIMKGESILLAPDHAEVLMAEFRRTAEFRKWGLSAAAIMANHVHLVVAVPDVVAGERLLQEFESYSSRVLNQQYGARPNGSWWTRSGSTRVLPNQEAVEAAIEYVRCQSRPLIVWLAGSV